MSWLISSSSDRRALDVVDGAGLFEGQGPHYSRRTPGSKTFTGVGQEIVLVTDCGRAVWAVVRQKTPMARGTGGGVVAEMALQIARRATCGVICCSAIWAQGFRLI